MTCAFPSFFHLIKERRERCEFSLGSPLVLLMSPLVLPLSQPSYSSYISHLKTMEDGDSEISILWRPTKSLAGAGLSKRVTNQKRVLPQGAALHTPLLATPDTATATATTRREGSGDGRRRQKKGGHQGRLSEVSVKDGYSHILHICILCMLAGRV